MKTQLNNTTEHILVPYDQSDNGELDKRMRIMANLLIDHILLGTKEGKLRPEKFGTVGQKI